MNFKDFFFSIESVSGLNEKRRNPDQNPKRGIYELAEKYKDDPDVYISFVSDLESDTTPGRRDRHIHTGEVGSPKIGINPRSVYDTPNGIYTYPLQSVYADDTSYFDIPFAENAPIVYFLKSKEEFPGIEDISNLTEQDYKDYIDKLTETFPDLIRNEIKKLRPDLKDVDFIPLNSHLLKLTIVKKASEDAKFQNSGGRLWNITRVFSTLLGQIITKKLKPEIFIAGGEDEKTNKYVILTLNTVYKLLINSGKTSYPNIWNSVWRKILKVGYVADKSGAGIIHSNEPTQAVFFSIKTFEILDVIKNDLPIKKNKQPSLYQQIKHNGEESDEVLGIIYNYLTYNDFDKINTLKKLSEHFSYLTSTEFAIRFLELVGDDVNSKPHFASVIANLLNYNKTKLTYVINSLENNGFSPTGLFFLMFFTDRKDPKFIQKMDDIIKQFLNGPNGYEGRIEMVIDAEEYKNLITTLNANGFDNDYILNAIKSHLYPIIQKQTDPIFSISMFNNTSLLYILREVFRLNVQYQFNSDYSKEILNRILSDKDQILPLLISTAQIIRDMFVEKINARNLRPYIKKILSDMAKPINTKNFNITIDDEGEFNIVYDVPSAGIEEGVEAFQVEDKAFFVLQDDAYINNVLNTKGEEGLEKLFSTLSPYVYELMRYIFSTYHIQKFEYSIETSPPENEKIIENMYKKYFPQFKRTY